MKKIIALTSLAIVALSALFAFRSSPSTEGITLIVSHDVKDFAVWKKAFDTDDKMRKGMGLETEAVYTSIEKPNEVTIVFHAPSVEVVKNLMGNPKLKEVQEKAGVISAPVVKMLHKQ